ncbi:MAG: glycogen debranching enzyme/alpha-amylase [Myxococcaceae bacterium]|nr:glycogen debranching enzyme/alpha-amylase [Myxococcaceae bacterium]
MNAPRMSPAPGEHLLRFVGDRLRVSLSLPEGTITPLMGFLRTNLTRAKVARAEVIAQAGLREQEELTFAGASWRDIPLSPSADGFSLELPLLEPGHFLAKAYFRDQGGRQYWPDGSDLSIAVHPDRLRTANVIYCAFTRAVGAAVSAAPTPEEAPVVGQLDQRGWSVIPPSSSLRSLTRALPHIFDQLGCRIVHLLPIGRVPTTFARMGRFGSPYAQLDLTSIDPALVEFDKRTTAVQQFRELADGVHLRGGMVILDIVLNHTGWGSRLMDEHPEWFKRDASGAFHSPGAWGTVWEDLVELDQTQRELWEVLSDALITWCRRGVDGFRCDAGYMVPVPVWQYIVARVRSEFPDCVFLLEGLGGAWSATESLLTEGGMQWAYSELFQCYTPREVSSYLDHSLRQSERIGTLVHYSETHDNDRLAKRGVRWSLMRNRLSALTSHSGAFGFTSGVEWLCTTRVNVHSANSLGWGAEVNLLDELGELNALLRNHPCFFDGARISRVSPDDSFVLAIERVSYDGRDRCLALINLDPDEANELSLPSASWQALGSEPVDLLGQPLPAVSSKGEVVKLRLAPGQSLCLAESLSPNGLSGELYRERRAQAAWAYTQLGTLIAHEALGSADFIALAELVAQDPAGFLATIAELDRGASRTDLLAAIAAEKARASYPRVVTFRPEHAQRITLVPPKHWLLVRDDLPFEVVLARAEGDLVLRSTPMNEGHVAAIPPHAGESETELTLRLNRFQEEGTLIAARVRLLAHRPTFRGLSEQGLVLLVNGRGGMARLHADLGAVTSKYDCLLAANYDPEAPSDRHILIKRMQAWVDADGFITPLDRKSLLQIESGPPAVWTFACNAGDGRRVGIRLTIDLLPDRNIAVLRCERVPTQSLDLDPSEQVRLVVRFDLEDRSFHGETHADEATVARFESGTSVLESRTGFQFVPAPDRTLTVSADRGRYFPGVQWTRAIFHAVDAERGLGSHGDAYSPGWFELPLAPSEPVTLVCSADREEPSPALVSRALTPRSLPTPIGGEFEAQLRRAAEAFIVRRGRGRTIVAGYPWFLDWGRDTFIGARGLIAAGYHEEVKHMLLAYAALERNGTLPNNFVAGAGEVGRETSDAPLWFALASEELSAAMGPSLYELAFEGQRSLREVLQSLAENLLKGAENGVRIDLASGLVWSPSHYTWMDTNYPAGTPREGYPIELSVLWLRFVRQLVRIGVRISGVDLEEQMALTQRSLTRFYRPELGYCADTLHAAKGVPASQAVADDHLRPNQLLAVSFGLIKGEAARAIVSAAERYLLVPGAIRTLAPKPVQFALPIVSANGEPLNDEHSPYWGHYVGDEDTRRKPAYHNGTAWGWWLGIYCEALAAAWDHDPRAIAAARAVLGSSGQLLAAGCIGQLPEIVDGDAPHTQRGCDAQAWSVTEALRVWLKLS